MKHHVLITGGAGFIGSFLVDELIKKGHKVRILDNLEPQVHQGNPPVYLNSKAEFIKGDLLNKEILSKALQDVDVILHHAAAVGIGQSMYEIAKFTEVNALGTANILDILANSKHNVKKLIIASSNTIYGEGTYSCKVCGPCLPEVRTPEEVKEYGWDPVCPKCKGPLTEIPTVETKPCHPKNIYALTKKYQEDMCLAVGKRYGIPTVALRYFNVFGPRQSLSNPYTGVVAIFMSRIKNNNAPVVYEDGLQTRDFVSVHDIVQANMLAIEKSEGDYEAFNVGSGTPTSIKQIALTLAKLYNKPDLVPTIGKEFRKGDIRHCTADITKIKTILGYEPKVSFEEQMKEIIAWSKTVEAVDDFEKATTKLKDKGLL